MPPNTGMKSSNAKRNGRGTRVESKWNERPNAPRLRKLPRLHKPPRLLKLPNEKRMRIARPLVRNAPQRIDGVRKPKSLSREAEQLAQNPLPPPPVTGEPIARAKYELSGDQRRNRAELLAQLNAMLVTRDTPRGLIVTVGDPFFESESSDALRPAATERLMRIASMLKAHPDLAVRVEGFTDDRQRGDICERRTDAVRAMLVRYGVASNSIQLLSYGSSRPFQSNATASGRAQNRRVEIVIAGQSIGDMALWDRTYSLKR